MLPDVGVGCDFHSLCSGVNGVVCKKKQTNKQRERRKKSCLMSPGLKTEKIAKLLREIHAKYRFYSKSCYCIYLSLAFFPCGSLRLEFSPRMYQCFAQGLKHSLPSAAGVADRCSLFLLRDAPSAHSRLPPPAFTGTCSP